MTPKQPWMKFYPSDWRSDAALRMCSIGARGLWMEMLCLMHDACGSLLINGKQVSTRQLAALAGITLKETEGLLEELEEAGVFSRDDDSTVYSRRIRRDIAKAERDRDNGKQGGNPTITKGVNPPDNGDHKAQRPETRSRNQMQRPDPQTPADAGSGRSVGLSDDFQGKLRKAVEGEPCAGDDDFGPIEAAMADGASEADVLEAIRRARDQITEPIRRWTAFSGFVRNVVEDRRNGVLTKAKPPPGPVVHSPPVELKPGVVVPLAELRKAIAEGRWYPRMWGPKPGETGCLVPAWVFEEVAA